MNEKKTTRKTPRSTFEDEILEVAKRSVVKLFTEGSLIAPDYHRRVKLPEDLAQKVYELIDYDAVLGILRGKINEMVAVKITHLITEELTNDVKGALSHEPTRRRLRDVVAVELDKIRGGK